VCSGVVKSGEKTFKARHNVFLSLLKTRSPASLLVLEIEFSGARKWDSSVFGTAQNTKAFGVNEGLWKGIQTHTIDRGVE